MVSYILKRFSFRNSLKRLPSPSKHIYITVRVTTVSGVAIGGGLFLIIVMIGVIFWISRELDLDQEMREEAEKLQGSRRRRNLVENVNCVLHDIDEELNGRPK